MKLIGVEAVDVKSLGLITTDGKSVEGVPKQVSERSEGKRWENYRNTLDEFPDTRMEELAIMLETVNPQPGERILEFSTGSGFLTIPLAQAVAGGIGQGSGGNGGNHDIPGCRGKLTSYDVIPENIADLRKRYLRLPIQAKLFQRGVNSTYHLAEEERSVDKIASLATFHHCDIRKTDYCEQDTGTAGRQSVFNEAARVLVPGGMFVIGDIAERTTTQSYFDAAQEPRYFHPNGHPHQFLTEDLAYQLAERAGLELVQYEVKETPWKFSAEEEAVCFLHGMHNAQCSYLSFIR